MADVAQKAVSANAVKNGDAVVGVDKIGNSHTLAPKIYAPISVEEMEAWLTDKYDSVVYYNS